MKSELSAAVATGRTYDVTIDRSSLTETELLGPGKGYSVDLEGPADRNWLESYRRLRVESPSFFRFCLEGRTVLFACRAGDILTDVESILRILQTLIRETNELASAAAPVDD